MNSRPDPPEEEDSRGANKSVSRQPERHPSRVYQAVDLDDSIMDSVISIKPNPIGGGRFGAAPKSNETGPSFKDQARSFRRHPPATAPGAVPALDRSPEPDKGPDFKAQVNSRSFGAPVTPREALRNGEDQAAAGMIRGDDPELASGPAFKDQARAVAPPGEQDVQAAPTEQQRETEVTTTDSNESPLLRASVVEEQTIFEAVPLIGGCFCKRRYILVSIAVLAGAAIAAGAVCSSGMCSSASKETVETTNSPTESPTAPPILEVHATASANETMDYINSITLGDGSLSFPILVADATPEHLALWWLLEEDPLALSSNVEEEQIHLTQRYALATFWYSLNGPSWTKSDGWLTAEDECSWFSIVCDYSTVTSVGYPELALGGNNLAGSIPADLALLSSLGKIDLRNNPELSGSLPSSIGRFSFLESFFVSECSLTGDLPSTIGKWNNIKMVELQGNNFTGLPSSVDNWTSLMHIRMDDISFNTTLPDISRWTNLQSMTARRCSFSGSLPSLFGKLSRLQIIDVSRNNLTSSLPDSIGDLERLEMLALNDNLLTGPLPSSIGNCTSLTFLALSSNELTGSLPESIGNLVNLVTFNFFFNSFTGTLPDTIGNLKVLEEFGAGNDDGNPNRTGNALEGTLPESIGGWNRLSVFNVFDNNFSGSLPATVGEWESLWFFDVSLNNFNSTIPESIENWQSIEQAYFLANSFEGTVPPGICGAPSLQALWADCESEIECSFCDLCI